MIKIFAILLSLAILVLSSGKTFILLNYAVNKEFIAKNLCENRNKPKMNCNGKCHLKKELQKEEKKDQSPFSSMKEKVEVQLFNSHCKVNAPILSFEKINLSVVYNQNYSSLNSGSIFHPPQA